MASTAQSAPSRKLPAKPGERRKNRYTSHTLKNGSSGSTTAAGYGNKGDVIGDNSLQIRTSPPDSMTLTGQRTGPGRELALTLIQWSKYRETDDDQGRWQYPRRRSEARRKWANKSTSVAKTRLTTTKNKKLNKGGQADNFSSKFGIHVLFTGLMIFPKS